METLFRTKFLDELEPNLKDLLEKMDEFGLLSIGVEIEEFQQITIEPDYGFEIPYMLENADEQVCCDFGLEDFEEYSGVSEEAKEELKTVLKKWADKYVDTSRYYLAGATPIRIFSVTEEHIKMARGE